MSGSVYNVANDVQNVLSTIFTNGLANSSPLAAAFSAANQAAGTEPFQQLQTAFRGFSAGYQVLQLSTTEVAVKSTTSTPVYTAVVLGSGMSVSSTNLGNTLGITGTISSIQLYSGGSFANGVVTGGAVVATVTFTPSAWTLTSGTSTLTIAGDNLPTSVSAVDAVLAGNYNGTNFDISSVSLTNNGTPLISAALSAGQWTITSGPLTFVLAGANLPNGVLTVESLIDGTYTGPAIGLSSIKVEDAGAVLGTVSLTSTALTVTAGGYALALDGTNFPTSFTATEIDSAVQSGNLGVLLGNASATSVTLTDLATGQVELTRALNNSSPVDLSTYGVAAFIESAFLTSNPVYYGQTLTNPTVIASESLDVYYGGVTNGATVQNGGYEVVSYGGNTSNTTVQNGGFEIVNSGGVAAGTNVQNGGVLDVLSGGSLVAIYLDQGGVVELSGLAYSSAIIEAVSSEGPFTLVTLSEGGVEVGGIALFGSYTADQLALSSDGAGGTLITDVACYLRGTRILTERGLVAIEDLAVGDRVMTHFDPAVTAKPITWIGHSVFDATRHPHPDHVTPIRIRAGALGEGLPLRDLLVSPGHSLVFGEVLIQAERLVNGASIIRDHSITHGEYFHIEVAGHDIVLAEGVAAESYLDVGNRSNFTNNPAFVALHLDFSPQDWQNTCLPLVMAGPQLLEVKQRLLDRAKANGYTLTNDPAVRLLADGKLIAPYSSDGEQFSFALPETCHDIRLLSRRWVPSELDPACDDLRRLGVCVHHLALDGVAQGLNEAWLDEAGPETGWYGLEADGPQRFRWTNGEARLLPGTTHVVLTLGGVRNFWVERDEAEAGSGNSNSLDKYLFRTTAA